MGYFFSRLEREQAALGYVDPAGLMDLHPGGLQAGSAGGDEGEAMALESYDTREAAQAALDAGQIDAYYLLPDGFEGETELVYYEAPADAAVHAFEDAVRRSLLAGQPPEVAERLLSQPTVSVLALDTGREFPSVGPQAGDLAPLVAAAIFGFLAATTSGYMMGVVVTEKENRTMEVVVTSVSPGQMMSGKLLGALGLAALQLAVWLACLFLALFVGRDLLRIDWLQELSVRWPGVAATIVVAVPFFFSTAALMTLAGTMFSDTQEANQAGGLFFIPLFLPFYLFMPIAQNPNGPLALALTFFPVTSLMTIDIRSMFAEVPAWQVGAAAGLALAAGAVLVWLTGKALRLGMLRYGKRLRLSELFRGG
jgi:ABC-2 type transport system permease protein